MSKQDLMVVTFGKGKNEVSITADEVRQYLCPSITNTELYITMGIIKSYGLNPFKKEAYIIKYGQNPAQVVVGYEVYLKRAERHGDWRGMKVWTTGEIVRGKDWREKTTLKGCIEIHRKNWKLPLYWEVEFQECCQCKRDGTLNTFWNNKPKTMIKKVVIAQGMRKAFPDEVGGMPLIREEANVVEAEVETLDEKIQKAKEPRPAGKPGDTPEKPANSHKSSSQAEKSVKGSGKQPEKTEKPAKKPGEKTGKKGDLWVDDGEEKDTPASNNSPDETDTPKKKEMMELLGKLPAHELPDRLKAFTEILKIDEEKPPAFFNKDEVKRMIVLLKKQFNSKPESETEPEQKSEPPAEQKSHDPFSNEAVCSKCGRTVTEKCVSWCKKKYKKIYCFLCQKKVDKAGE